MPYLSDVESAILHKFTGHGEIFLWGNGDDFIDRAYMLLVAEALDGGGHPG